MAEVLLKIEELTKSFGGLVAIQQLSMEVEAGEIHAVIGPNGAGKTTLIAQLSGSLKPDSGRIVFENRDITHVPEYRRSALGLARSFQITSVLKNFSAWTTWPLQFRPTQDTRSVSGVKPERVRN